MRNGEGGTSKFFFISSPCVNIDGHIFSSWPARFGPVKTTGGDEGGSDDYHNPGRSYAHSSVFRLQLHSHIPSTLYDDIPPTLHHIPPTLYHTPPTLHHIPHSLPFSPILLCYETSQGRHKPYPRSF